MFRTTTVSREIDSTGPPQVHQSGGWGQAWVHLGLAAVLLARWLTPTEGSFQGDTLWIALLSGLVLGGWCLSRWGESSQQLRWSWLDAFVVLFIGGHVVSALGVILGTGARRLATTLLWEWVGVGITYFLVRQVLSGAAERRQWSRVWLTWGLVLALGGLWQHFIGYRETVREYDKLVAQWDSLQQQLAQTDPWRLRQLEQEQRRLEAEFLRSGIPLDPHARQLFEQRLKESREPLGPFALANTFAGFLLVSLLIWLVRLFEFVQQPGPETATPRDGRQVPLFPGGRSVALGVGGLAAGVLAYCLLLTKSRTAYVGSLWGLMTGLGAWWVSHRATSRHSTSPPLLSSPGGRGVAALGLILVSLLGVAAWSGSLDRFVVSESFKSLRYRLEYWQGTWGVLCESPRHWLLGVGPGNFRQHYLQHKLPGSSEEIFDPHNFLLDVWVNGGLLSLLGTLLILGGIARAVLRQMRGPQSSAGRVAAAVPPPPTETSDNQHRKTIVLPPLASVATRKIKMLVPEAKAHRERRPPRVRVNALFAGGMLGVGLVTLFGQNVGELLWFEALVWLVTWIATARLFSPATDCLAPPTPEQQPSLSSFSSTGVSPQSYADHSPGQAFFWWATVAGFVGLSVHLMGAGGIAMPAISQLWLLLVAWMHPPQNPDSAGAESWGVRERVWRGGNVPSQREIVATLVAVLGLCVAMWHTGLEPVLTSRRWLNAAMDNTQPQRREAFLRQATRADPWSPDAWQGLAEEYFRRWSTQVDKSSPAAERDFARGMQAMEQARQVDPHNYIYSRLQGNWEVQRFSQGAEPASIRAAVEYLKAAVALYPHLAVLQAELADALWQAEQVEEARRAAQLARDLHQLNVTAGHKDKWLTPAQLERLQQIAPSNSAPNP